MAKVTIDTISRYTGLSRGTVSRALNNRADISQATRQRVLDACKLHNYVPNTAARALATGRGYALAVFVADLCSLANRDILKGILSAARAGGYSVQLTSTAGEPQAVSLALRAALNERIDAAFALARIEPERLDEFNELLGTRPFAHLDAATATGDAWLFDEAEAGALIARHFIAAGVPGGDVAYLHDERADEAGRRRRGFVSACEREGIRPTVVHLGRAAPGDGPEGWSEAREVLRRARAVACSDDTTALQALLVAQQLGRVVGHDLLLVGQGNEGFTTAITPQLSTVDFGGEEIGRRATEALLQRVRGERQDGPVETRVTPRLIVRESSAPRV